MKNTTDHTDHTVQTGIAAYFVAKGRAAARFVPSKSGGDCSTCIRKQYSYPDTCAQGWDRLREGRLEPCANHVTRENR